uniref:Uncharacterized protein n=1 Tax=Glossina palpalis gambiensis TaxID=67801 RepID=A0A1B0BJB8_9MUSC
MGSSSWLPWPPVSRVSAPVGMGVSPSPSSILLIILTCSLFLRVNLMYNGLPNNIQVVGSFKGSSKSDRLRNTLPRDMRHNIRSNEKTRSRLITPATNPNRPRFCAFDSSGMPCSPFTQFIKMHLTTAVVAFYQYQYKHKLSQSKMCELHYEKPESVSDIKHANN